VCTCLLSLFVSPPLPPLLIPACLSILVLAQVLRFFGYFKEGVVESNIENHRVRKVILYYYLEDGSMHAAEPKQDNSGIPQARRQTEAKCASACICLYLQAVGKCASACICLMCMQFARPSHVHTCNLSARGHACLCVCWLVGGVASALGVSTCALVCVKSRCARCLSHAACYGEQLLSLVKQLGKLLWLISPVHKAFQQRERAYHALQHRATL